jgi:hypothetical protein
MTLFTEVLPVASAAIPKHAWRIDVRGGDFATIGGKLSCRLRKVLGGHWVWTSSRIVTDFEATAESVMGVVNTLWREQLLCWWCVGGCVGFCSPFFTLFASFQQNGRKTRKVHFSQ